MGVDGRAMGGEGDERQRGEGDSRLWEVESQPFGHWCSRYVVEFTSLLGKTSISKVRFLSGIARKGGGGLPMPEFFGTFFTK